MRNNHDKKNHKLAKRTFALCLALAVICSCLLPVFATEGGIATFQNEAAASSDSIAVQPGGDIAVQPGGGIVAGPVVDDSSSSESTASGTESSSKVELPKGATDFVDNGDGTYTYKDAAGNTVKGWFIGKDDKTTWTGEEAVVKPNPNLKEDDAAFGVLPIEYHFWLRQLDSFELSNLAWETEVSDYGTETEYLAVFGDSTGFPIWHMDTISSVDTISNYTFDDPTSKDDPAGEGREFAYWYTVDSTGLKHEFDPYKTYGSETNTVINVYAAWKDASGDVVEDDTTKKDEETKADTAKTGEASGKAKLLDNTNVELTITAKGLPTTATHLTVSNMGNTSMEQFYNLYTSLGGKMTPFIGFKISPKDAGGNTVEPTSTVTVTISGLGNLGLEALPGLKVLHQTVSHTVETLDASYDAATGILTFQTTSFSPFVIAYKSEGNEATTLVIGDKSISVGEEITITGAESTNGHSWSFDRNGDSSCVTVSGTNTQTITVKGEKEGTVTLTHQYYVKESYWWYGTKYEYNAQKNETVKITVTAPMDDTDAAIFILKDPDGDPEYGKQDGWGYAVMGATVSGPRFTGTISNILDNTSYTLTKPASWTEEKITYNGKEITAWCLPDTEIGYNYLYENDSTYAGQTQNMWEQILEKYKDNIKTADGQVLKNYNLAKKDIDKIYVIPYKLAQQSQANTGDNNVKIPGLHIDCQIVVKCKNTYSVNFHIKDAGATDFTRVSASTYIISQTSSIRENNGLVDANGDYIYQYDNTVIYRQEKTTADGVKYVFDGWYTDPNFSPASKVSPTSWPVNVTEDDIKDHNKEYNYYARYVPASADLTISKTVTGIFGDHNATYTFQITDAEGNAVDLSKYTIESSKGAGTNVGLVDGGKDGKFTLADLTSITIKNLPSGTYTVTEEGAAAYKTSWKLTVGGDTVSESTKGENAKSAGVTMTGISQTLDFTNDLTLPVDAGVLLDTLPYILILAVVVGGGALLLMRKRRKDEDD